MKSYVKKLPWAFPVLLDLITGLLVAIIAFEVKPTLLASFISIVYVSSIIIPGLFLSGYARKACFGSLPTKKNILLNSTFTFLANLITLLVFFLYFKEKNQSIRVIITTVSYFSMASAFQPFNIIWYYIYKDKVKYLKIKFISSLIRLLGAILAIIFNEVAFVIIFVSATQITDALFGIKLLPDNHHRKNNIETTISYATYGLSTGMTRSTNSIIKILIEKSATTYLPTLILFEQIFAGFIGIYEKYFMVGVEFPKSIKTFKHLWIFFALTYYIYYYFTDYIGYKNSSLLLFLMASLTILPPYYIYSVMKSRGLLYVASFSLIISFITIFFISINYFWIKSPPLYGIIYMINLIIFFQFFNKKSEYIRN